MSFRSDINGLRAWAVVLVILFHFGIPVFPGGGIGVDIFFVISGYLMTRIIYTGIYNEKWGVSSLFNFYLARGIRIIPALFILCLLLICLGYFYLTFSDFKELSLHLIGALGFFSNFIFLNENGYFDSSSHTKFLLHTWSLSVEWQFYLIFPLFLFLLNKITKDIKKVSFIILIAFISSLALSVFYTEKSPSASFYLVPTRVWEMLTGSLVYIYFEKLKIFTPPKKYLDLIGILIIILSSVFITQEDIWPGYLAIIPVIGTAMVIAAEGKSFLTNHAITQWIGKISYSLYLWHWPLTVLLIKNNYFGKTFPTILALFLSFILGWISWRFIEKNSHIFLKKLNLSAHFFFLTYILFIVFLSFTLSNLSSKLEKVNKKALEIYSEKFNKNPLTKDCHVSGLKKVPDCIYGNEDIGVIVIGDSHANSLVRSIEKSFEPIKKGVLHWGLSSCPTIIGVKRKEGNYRCGEQVKDWLEKSKSIPPQIPLIIINRSSSYTEGRSSYEIRIGSKATVSFLNEENINNTGERIKELNRGMIYTACEFAKQRKVYMMRPIPEMDEDVPTYMQKQILNGSKDSRVSISIDDYRKRHQKIISAQDEAANKCGVTLLDPLPYLCYDGRCWGDNKGMPIYFDDDHLSERGGTLLIPLFTQLIKYY